MFDSNNKEVSEHSRALYFAIGFFIVLLHRFWSRSSMDRIMDSGSIDWSSSLHGTTKKDASLCRVASFLLFEVNLISGTRSASR